MELRIPILPTDLNGLLEIKSLIITMTAPLFSGPEGLLLLLYQVQGQMLSALERAGISIQQIFVDKIFWTSVAFMLEVFILLLLCLNLQIFCDLFSLIYS